MMLVGLVISRYITVVWWDNKPRQGVLSLFNIEYPVCSIDLYVINKHVVCWGQRQRGTLTTKLKIGSLRCRGCNEDH